MQNVMIENVNLPVIEVNGERVIAMADVDRVHGRQKGTASTRFQRNKKRFTLGRDYYETTLGELNKLMVQNTIKGRPTIKTFLLTKSGYLMLVKVLNDDKAWEVQRKLVDCYFDAIQAKADNETVNLIDVLNRLNVSIEKQNNLLAAIAKVVEAFSVKNTVTEIPAAVEVKAEPPRIEVKAETPKPKRKPRNIDKDLISAEYKAWKANLDELLKGYDKTAVIRAACNKLHTLFGISWADERTNFLRANDRFPADGNLELAYQIEKRTGWKNIFVNALCDTAEQFKKIEVPYHYPAENLNDFRGIVTAIAKKRNVNMLHLYRHIFATFRRETEFRQELAEEDYRKQYGHKGKMLEVIEYACKPQFLDWFNKFAEKEFSEIEFSKEVVG